MNIILKTGVWLGFLLLKMLPIYLFIGSYVVLSSLVPRVIRYWRESRALQCRRRVVLFSRYPISGRTKTRLIQTLGASGAATLQLLMTNHMLDTLSKCSSKQLLRDLCIELRHHGGGFNQLDYWVGKRDPFVLHRPQAGHDLGDKMACAFADAFKEGAKNVLVVGSDIPGITEEVIKEGFQVLESGEAEMILGPAKDGGYYTVGMTAAASKHLADVFEGINWGTSQVLQQQTAVAHKLGLKIKLLTTKLSDVDLAEDLPEVERAIGITPADILKPSWSVIIPVLNERRNIERSIRHLLENSDAPDRLEIILADGGSEDKPEEIVNGLQSEVKGAGATLKLVHCTKGRGPQLNEGAAVSSHKLLLFLHIDTMVPKHFDTMAWHTIVTPGVTAGTFQFGLDVVHLEEKKKTASWWFLQEMRLLEWGTQKRVSKFEKPYGDQGLFMWRETFERLGGYPPFRLMEDYVMISRIKKFGHVKVVVGAPALTSARRWEKYGYLRVTGFNSFIILAYKCGVSPDTLARWYYGK